MWLLGIFAIIYSLIEILGEKFDKQDNPNDYMNFELYMEDWVKLSDLELKKNIDAGKYRDTEELKKNRRETNENFKFIEKSLNKYK